MQRAASVALVHDAEADVVAREHLVDLSVAVAATGWVVGTLPAEMEALRLGNPLDLGSLAVIAKAQFGDCSEPRTAGDGVDVVDASVSDRTRRRSSPREASLSSRQHDGVRCVAQFGARR